MSLELPVPLALLSRPMASGGCAATTFLFWRQPDLPSWRPPRQDSTRPLSPAHGRAAQTTAGTD
eukprot:5612134-Pyramimonas_sp.AAC.1